MTAESIIAVSAAVVALTQLAKWSGIPDRLGPLAVLIFALTGVLFWGWSHAVLSRAVAWDFFAAWIAIATSASGVYGFTRAAASTVVQLLPPPVDGAGSEPTVK